MQHGPGHHIAPQCLSQRAQQARHAIDSLAQGRAFDLHAALRVDLRVNGQTDQRAPRR